MAITGRGRPVGDHVSLLDRGSEQDRLEPLAGRSCQEVESGVRNQQDGGGQVPGPAQREVRGTSERDERHDIEAGP